MINSELKEKYLRFAESQQELPLFHRPWWLDSVCGAANWGVAMYEKGGRVWASMPYYVKKQKGFVALTMPRLTRYLGPFILYPEGQKYQKKLSWEKEVMTALAEQLPRFDIFKQLWGFEYTNWLPFYWKQFRQTTLYTYYISHERKEVRQEFDNDIRRRIKKAESLNIEVVEMNDVQRHYDLVSATYARKGLVVPYTCSFLERLVAQCCEKAYCRMYFAVSGNEPLATGLFVGDSQNVYYLTGGVSAEKKDLGGMDLLLVRAIGDTLAAERNFDFEGSMNESIENYFRSFGSRQRQQFLIYKVQSPLLRLLNPILKLV
ncbi:MAG: GNAT family N-acetyltransferase [Flavobacteriales bacterium]|nr:GNAT family N-acetyltransferase [Flavobacteriales bacterium]MDW8410779.1 GNAT family N-acetyltransferase [Flavobacteriales bacterium]